jgi:cytosine/adenosine deaminase-related metal-dependent hydrolase
MNSATYWCEWAWMGSAHREPSEAAFAETQLGEVQLGEAQSGETQSGEETLSGDGFVAAGVVIEIVGDRIVNVVTGVLSAPTNSILLRGVTMPGIVNGHSHAFHRGLRGHTHGETGSFWTWRNQMYALADRLNPDTYRDLAVAAYAEMVLAGFTAVGEFHYLHHGPGGVPYANPNEMTNALIDAAAVAGIRITLLDTCYLQAGLGGTTANAPAPGDAMPGSGFSGSASGVELSPTQQRFSDGDVDRWIDRVDSAASSVAIVSSPTVKLGAAIHSVRAVPRSALSPIAQFAKEKDFSLHAHVSEQPAENEQCLAVHGLTPTELLHEAGALYPSFTAVHATHLTKNDRSLYEQTGASCCICPTTERDLADGIGPTAQLRSAGVPMSIGSDSHAVVDPFEEVRALEMHQRLANLVRGNHQPDELLTMATSIGAHTIGWPDAGQLIPGALADFITVSLDSPRLAGTDAQFGAALVYCASAADVVHVVMGGRVVVANGTHASVDVPRALSASIKALWS